MSLFPRTRQAQKDATNFKVKSKKIVYGYIKIIKSNLKFHHILNLRKSND